MSLRFPLSIVAVVAAASIPAGLEAQGRPYTQGSVWDISMVRTTDGMMDDYLRSLSTTWRRTLDEAKKQGLVLSYKVISAGASGPNDWDLLLMVEYKNWAALDGLAEKMDPIERSVVGNDDQMRQLMTKRLDVRHFIGTKTGQELILK